MVPHRVEAGFGKIEMVSWDEFVKWILTGMEGKGGILDHKGYIWRGQRCDDWPLEPTLNRALNQYAITEHDRPSFRKSHLKRFKYSIRGRRGPNPPQNLSENEWWALGQHYGLSTPLLDWTESPLVAAYFAFMHINSEQTPNRAVFALHRKVVEDRAKEIYDKERIQPGEITSITGPAYRSTDEFLHDANLKKPIEVVRPMSDENHRLVSQGGLFTRTPDDTDIESWVTSTFSEEKESYILMKILIPNKDREQCLKGLNRMNINHLTLFPDLFGASVFCNMHCELKNY